MERAISRVLADKADLPRVVTLSVSTVGGLLVVVNVVLVACVLHRRRQRQGSQGKEVNQVPVHPGGGGNDYIGGGGNGSFDNIGGGGNINGSDEVGEV